MKIYLNSRLEQIPIFSQLKILLGGFMEMYKDEFPKPTDIEAASRMLDPVRNYIQYHLLESGQTMDEGRLSYIVNSLYKTKGAPEVIEKLSEVLCTEIAWDYEFPALINLEFTQLSISNLALYESKLKLALEHLLYVEDLQLKIRELCLLFMGELTQTISYTCTPYIFIDSIGSVEYKDFEP